MKSALQEVSFGSPAQLYRVSSLMVWGSDGRISKVNNAVKQDRFGDVQR